MLTEIREGSSGFFAWIIAALIIIPMAFWGVQEYASTDAMPTIIEVGDQKITQNAYRAELAQAQARASQSNPNLANSDIFNSDFYKRQVLDGMVSRALVRDIAEQQKYVIGDKQLANLIKASPLFQKDGEFDKEGYEVFVASRDYSKNQFEKQMRDNTRMSQVASGYEESALVLPDEVRELLEIQSEQRGIDLITISQADYLDSVQVSDAEISEYYQANQSNFMEPDRMSISYLELSSEALASEISVDEDTLLAVYRDSIESYTATESRTASHILLSTSAGEDEDAQLAKAQELTVQLEQGADFATLAKENSQDPGSAANGGSLGDVGLGEMVPEFEEAAFALSVGEISQPVRSQFGYHIIKVDEIKGGEALPFEEVKSEIEQEERERLAQDRMIEKVEQLKNALFEQSDSLAAAAEQLDLEVKTSTLFSRESGEGITSNEAVRAAAFSEQVSIDEVNSEVIELADGVYIALRKLDFQASAPTPLASVSAEIGATLKSQKASDAAKQAGDAILDKANTAWSDLEKDPSIEIASHTVSMIDTEQKVPADVLQEVVKMQLDGASPKVTSFSGANGDFNIVRLNKIAPGNLTQISEQVKESTRRMIAQRNGQSLFQSYLEGMSEGLDEEINDNLL